MPTSCRSYSNHWWWQFMPSLVVLLGITYLSLVKDVPVRVMPDIPLADKWGHMLAYMVLALCLAGDSFRARVSTRALYLLTIVPPIAYGGLIELIQPHFPPRMGEWSDWLADCIGVGVGLMLFALFHLWHTHRAGRCTNTEK